MRARWSALLIAVCVMGPGMARAQGTPPLGPRDGPLTPATDLERVKVGDQAPDFTLAALDGRRLTLSNYRNTRNVVLVFYRGHW